MSEKEFQEIKKVLREQQEEVKNSKKAAQRLLKDLGILTPKGKLTKDFKVSE